MHDGERDREMHEIGRMKKERERAIDVRYLYEYKSALTKKAHDIIIVMR